jgi:hypothetical protein
MKWDRESRRQKNEVQSFQERLYQRWGPAIEKLRMLLTISREFGSNLNSDLRSSDASDRPILIDVLTRLHARACQVTEEVLCLLSAGFADGALARWRTLHEIAVISLFIREHGEQLAERYVLHQAIDAKWAAEQYQKVCNRLGYDEYSEADLSQIGQSYEEAIKKFGPDFGQPNGWAAGYLSTGKKRRIKFADIEREAKIDHLRAHYGMASHNVHANARGIFFKLGLFDESQVLLAGPSNSGLADPGHATAIALCQVSSCLVILDPTIDNFVQMKIMSGLCDEIGVDLMNAHTQLLRDEAELRAGNP